MSLNKTYDLICNNENPNIQIAIPYNDYFTGLDVSESEGKVEYKLTPIKTGVTDFIDELFSPQLSKKYDRLK